MTLNDRSPVFSGLSTSPEITFELWEMKWRLGDNSCSVNCKICFGVGFWIGHGVIECYLIYRRKNN